MSKPKVLFVDDEANIRLTLPRILSLHEFEVTTTSTVAEALAAIHSQQFDILLTDLNIGEPGDGFTVVSAMRRTQPGAVTMILTGYPAFETALEAIRKQVDYYRVKPANIEELVNKMRHFLGTQVPKLEQQVQRVGLILAEQRENIVREWLVLVNSDHELGATPMSDAERVDFVPKVLDALIRMLNSPFGRLDSTALEGAVVHGKERRVQGYTVPMLISEMAILRSTIAATVQENLLRVEISFLLPDMAQINSALDTLVQTSVAAFLRETHYRDPGMSKEPEAEYGT